MGGEAAESQTGSAAARSRKCGKRFALVHTVGTGQHEGGVGGAVGVEWERGGQRGEKKSRKEGEEKQCTYFPVYPNLRKSPKVESGGRGGGNG